MLPAFGASPRVLFGPEHGIGGEAQDMASVEDEDDGGFRRPRSCEGGSVLVRSLYGSSFASLSPKEADLAGIDVLVIDLQDVGARYYTFVWTALLALRACHRAGVRVVVLDRPNPLGHLQSTLEGKLPEASCLSFVGLEALPVRHSLTVGEVLAWRARVEGIPTESLEIVSRRGRNDEAQASEWDRPFIMPSPNMPTYDVAQVYPGGCLLEGTNLSEGRGTTRPFEIFGAPWIDGRRLATDAAALNLPGVRFRPLTFRPTFHKHAGQTCGGLQVHPTDRSFRSYATYLALIALAKRQNPEAFRFRTEAYEFVEDIPAFDLLTGSPRAREWISREETGPMVELVEQANAGKEELARFVEARAALAAFAL